MTETAMGETDVDTGVSIETSENPLAIDTDESEVQSKDESEKSEDTVDTEDPKKAQDDSEPSSGKNTTRRTRPGKAERRIRQLTLRVHELESKLADGVNNTSPGDAPKDKPESEDYESYEEFIDALTDWKVDSRLKQSGNSKTSPVSSTAKPDIPVSFIDARDIYEDFDEIVFAEDQPVSAVMAEAVQDSEVGGEMLYDLLKNNPKEAKRIYKLPKLQALRAMGRLEAAYLSGESSGENSEAEQQKPKTVKSSKTPPPINPEKVKGQASVSSNEDVSDYVLRRTKELRQKGLLS